MSWGAKLAGVPRVRLTLKMPGNHLLTTWKPPATYMEGFWMKNITWGAKIVLGPLQSKSNVISDEKTTGNII